MLVIRRDLVDAMVAHARRDHPDEACGVVAGPEGSDRAERFVPMVNAAGSPTFYEFDPSDLLALYKEMDARDEEPVVIYHSHTATEAYPSRTDIGLAMEPNAHYVLVSTREHGNSDDPVGPELHRPLTIPTLACAHHHVVGVGLHGQTDVGARGVGLGRGVGVVDHDRLLAAVVHLTVEPEQVHGVELVERRRARRVDHRHESLRPVGPLRSGHHPARLVRVVTSGVRDDRIVDVPLDAQHAARLAVVSRRRGRRTP